MNHKRRKPKTARSGCLMCKPHKHQRAKDTLYNQTMQEKKERERDESQEMYSE